MSAPYRFRNPQLETTALTHKSFGRDNNERLEWLGDAVLEFEVSRLLYEKFGELSEGALTLMRVRLVCGETLADIARQLGLAKQLRLGKAAAMERNNDNILAAAMEAYIAAVYLDGGDIGALLAKWMKEEINALAAMLRDGGEAALRDPKTQLQEHVQQRGLPPPTYNLIKQEGAAHKRIFSVECCAQKGVSATATASSMAAAEKSAAEKCLRQLLAASTGKTDNR